MSISFDLRSTSSSSSSSSSSSPSFLQNSSALSNEELSEHVEDVDDEDEEEHLPRITSIVDNNSRINSSAWKCRLCYQLAAYGFESQLDIYEQNIELRNFYLPPPESCDRRGICACDNDNDNNTRLNDDLSINNNNNDEDQDQDRNYQSRVHVLCLQRWIRSTADKPCPRCRRRYEAPQQLIRLNTFDEFVTNNYPLQLAITIWFANAWLLRELIRAIFAADDNDNKDAYQPPPPQRYYQSNESKILSQIRWSTLLLFAAFINVFILNYFYLLYRSSSSSSSSASLIQFHYRTNRAEAYQLYSTITIAENARARNVFRSAINYGTIHDACSWCGQSVINNDNDNNNHNNNNDNNNHRLNSDIVIRYVCDCAAYHRRCLAKVTTATSPASGLSNFRCPNCARLFDFRRANMIARRMRDRLISWWPSLEPDAGGGENRPILADQNYSIFTTKIAASRDPSFARYLLRTRFGVKILAQFLAAIIAYIAAELWINSGGGAQHVVQNRNDANDRNDRNDRNGFAFSISPIRQWCWLAFRISWFTCEFIRLSYRAYLRDFDRHRHQLRSRFIFH